MQCALLLGAKQLLTQYPLTNVFGPLGARISLSSRAGPTPASIPEIPVKISVWAFFPDNNYYVDD